MTKSTRKPWNGTYTWDNIQRDSYLGKESPLENAWKNQILAKRSKAEVEEAAAAKYVLDLTELKHLERMQGQTVRIGD